MQDGQVTSVFDDMNPKMIVKTGLLIISNPKHIGKVLAGAKNNVNNTLYIQLLSSLTDPFGSYHPHIFNCWPKFSQTIREIYAQAANHCEGLDTRVLLSGLKYQNLKYIQTQKPIDLIIFDKKYSQDDVDVFIKNKIKTIAKGYSILTNDTGIVEEPLCDSQMDYNVYKHTVLGGTFDRLHIAHKLLLTEAALRSSEKITVGVTEENMVENKTLWELIEPIDKRIQGVKEFLGDIDVELQSNVVPIDDLYGPTKDDPTMDVLIVSAETTRGGNKVNELRASKGLNPLKIFSVELIEEPRPFSNEETKISSSTARIRSLGTLLRPVEPNKSIPNKPYIIGLTGGIASGKSGVASKLAQLGAHIIDCDKIAWHVYEPGKHCYEQIVNAFGKHILSEDGTINRRALGAIVFKDPKELEKLNSIVWPAMMEEIENQIRKVSAKVVVIEAAILIKSGWNKYCHEVWTTVVPPNEAVKRLHNRNGLSEDEAKSRISSQMKNKQYVDAANVVFCPCWEDEHIWRQVDKAWGLLQARIPS